MLWFVVAFIFPRLVQGIHSGPTSGLHFDINQEYASSYEDYKPRDYKFEYGVSDPYTGDHKSHWELRENGVVRGEYRLLEPDGTTRIVQYTADDHNGFRAVVKKIGKAVHPLDGHDSTNSYSSTILEGRRPNYDSEPNYKTYDGSGEKYVNSLSYSPHHYPLSNINPSQRLPESQSTQGSLLNNVGDINGSLQPENTKILEQESYNIPDVIPSHHYIHSQFPSEGIIENGKLISSYIDKPAYISRNINLDSQEHVPASVPVRKQVYTSGLMPLNNEYLPLPIQIPSVVGYPSINNAQEQHSPTMQHR